MSSKHVTWNREDKLARTVNAEMRATPTASDRKSRPIDSKKLAKTLFLSAFILLALASCNRPGDTSRLFVCSICGNAYYSFEDAAYCHNAHVEVYRGYVDKDGFITIAQER